MKEVNIVAGTFKYFVERGADEFATTDEGDFFVF